MYLKENSSTKINHLTLKAKIHLKMSSAQVVCCIFLLTLFDLYKYRGEQCGPRSDCSYRSSLIWVHIVNKLLIHFSRWQKQTTLRVKFLTIILTLSLPIFFVLKMLSAYYICCIYLNALQSIFTMEANNMNSYWSSLIRIHIVCKIGYQNT